MNVLGSEFSAGSGLRVWGHMTVEEVREALSLTQTAILPTGSTEQHGYHLPTLVDSITAYMVAVGASQQCGCFVVPPLHYSFSGGGLPGTIDISPGLTAAVLTEIGGSLYRQGIRNMILLHGHCGTENVEAHQLAVPMLYRIAPDARIAVAPIYRLSKTWKEAMEDRDYHAGFIETSLILYLAPDLVRGEEKWLVDSHQALAIPDQDAWAETVYQSCNELVFPHKKMKSNVKIGVWGDPSRSSRELGEKVFHECVESLTTLVADMESGR